MCHKLAPSSTWATPEVLPMQQIGPSDEARSSGSLKVEYTVQPPDNKVAAIPDKASVLLLST